LWQHGHALYSDLFVDRPQGLLLIYRGLLVTGLTSTVALRLFAAGIAVATVLVVAAIAFRFGERINSYAAALLLATVGTSPFIESFTLSGELLAALFAALCLLAFTFYVRDGRLRWAALAGVLCGGAVMMKQSGFDAGLAAALWLVLAGRRRPGAWRALVLLVAGAAVPVLVGILAARSPTAWFEAVVAYRGRGDSLFTGSPLHRFHLLVGSLPAAAAGLGLLAVFAAYGWRRSHLLLRLWVAAAVLGVLGGGNFHPHYYVQLAPPLAAVGGMGITRLRSRRVALSALAAAALAAAAATVSVALASTSEQVRLIWPHDAHLRYDADAVRLIRQRVPPGRQIAVVWGDADLYYLADRAPAVRYLWYRNAQAIPGAARHDIRVLTKRPVALVVTFASVRKRYPPLGHALACGYRLFATRGPLELYAPLGRLRCR
jgi:4-amino-4-deoxy-L-arabinose transferase-like glycosyltransferase